MNRRQRALRNRQDRSKLNRHISLEQNEPKLDETPSVQAEEQEAKLEPALDIEKELKSDNEAPKASESVVEGLSAQAQEKDEEVSSNAQSAVTAPADDGSSDETQMPAFNATDLARTALKANYEQSAKVEETSADESQSEGTDDPDKVPVATTLTDEEVPNCPGAILMHAREILGLSQREVAYKLNCRVNVISDIEHDRLNQVTAIPFASAHIANYARLVNIDPNYLVSLYRQNVQKVVSEQAYAVRQNRSAEASSAVKKLVKAALLIGGAIAAVAVAVAVLSSGGEEKDSGALVIEDTVEATSASDGSLSIDTENSKLTTNIVPVEELEQKKEDPNTALARKQAMELDTNAIISNKTGSAQNEDSRSDVSLELKGEAAARVSSNSGAELIEEEPLLEENTLQSVSIDDTRSSVQANKKEESKSSSVLSLKTEGTKAEPAKAKSENVKAADEKAKKADEDAAKAAMEAKKKADEQKRAADEAKSQKVALAASLRDISSQVRVVKPEPLGSVNTIKIKVSGDVSLKIMANGRKVKEGSFRAGETVSAVGVPPFVVGATDTSRIQIEYRGGRVSVPAAKQVSFTLPQR